MYVTPVLTSDEWDTFAECAKWSRANAATLVDTHWIGGDPKQLEPYGWASWVKGKGIVTLRNPSDKRQSFALDVQRAFELPQDAPRNYTARSPWEAQRADRQMLLTAGREVAIELDPFEVLTLEATPR
jgi:hypothetical protein